MLKVLEHCLHFALEMCMNPVVHSSVLDEDEVGDRITVRSDEELKAMLSYVSIISALCFQVCCKVLFEKSAMSLHVHGL